MNEEVWIVMQAMGGCGGVPFSAVPEYAVGGPALYATKREAIEAAERYLRANSNAQFLVAKAIMALTAKATIERRGLGE